MPSAAMERRTPAKYPTEILARAEDEVAEVERHRHVEAAAARGPHVLPEKLDGGRPLAERSEVVLGAPREHLPVEVQADGGAIPLRHPPCAEQCRSTEIFPQRHGLASRDPLERAGDESALRFGILDRALVEVVSIGVPGGEDGFRAWGASGHTGRFHDYRVTVRRVGPSGNFSQRPRGFQCSIGTQSNGVCRSVIC